MRDPGEVELREYGALALDHIQRRALYADRVDWQATRASIALAAAGATSPQELHPTIGEVLRQAGGEHSGLVPPGRRSRPGARSLPTASLVEGHAVLVLPSCPGDVRSVRAYTAAGGQAVQSLPPAKGWVVDLRGNSGGSMWPMLAVALPLLHGDRDIGAFVTRDGSRTPWRARGRRVGTGHWANARGRGPLRLPGPVAVLTDRRTASSGEAVAVAFRGLSTVRSYGSATWGFSTGNQTVRLPDGTLLVITTCSFADRTGVVYGGSLTPDTLTDDALDVAITELAQA